MNSFVLLSICLPVFNRKNEILKFLNSIDFFDNIELIIVDDGSTQNIGELFNKDNKYKFKFKYIKTKNRGRSSAICDAIRSSSGEYIMIMDSDDYFLPNGIQEIINEIKNNFFIKCFVFGTEILYNGKKIINKPPKSICTNLIKLRADYKVQGDLKEIVKKNYILKCLYEKSYEYRFTPTSLIWSKLSELVACHTIDKCVAVKTYKKEGISASISQIKFENAGAFCDLFRINMNSNLYNSFSFRLKSKIQYYRYLFSSNRIEKKTFSNILHYVVGYLLYLTDKIKFKNKKRAH